VCERFRALVPDLDPIDRERARDLLEEAGLLAHRLDERHARSGKGKAQSEPRESRTAPDVDESFVTGPGAHRYRAERIEEVFRRDIGRGRDRGEVHRRIAFDEELGKPRAQRQCRGVQTNADTLGIACERRERAVSGLAGRHGP
jgi:hypothetical protein